MKKFYFLTLAAAMSLSLSAATPFQTQSAEGLVANKELAQKANHEFNLSVANKHILADDASALTNADIAGDYEWEYVAMDAKTIDDLTYESVVITAKPRSTTGVNILFKNWGFSVSGTFNPEDATLTITTPQNAFTNTNYGQVYIYSGYLDEEYYPHGYEAGSLVGTLENGNFKFRDSDAIGIGIEGVGFFEFGVLNSFIKDFYVKAGTADYFDCWSLSAFTDIDYTELVLEAPLERHGNHEGVYRIVDPYKYNNYPFYYTPEELAQEEDLDAIYYNCSTTPGYIKFNVENDYPYLYMGIYSGLTMADFAVDGVADYYMSDWNGYVFNGLGYAPTDDGIEMFETNNPASAGKFEYSTYDPEQKIVSIGQGGFGFVQYTAAGKVATDASSSFYTWNSASMEGAIKLNLEDGSVNGVVAESEGTPVYYNLQGARVANPGNGIFIRVINGKAQKVLR